MTPIDRLLLLGLLAIVLLLVIGGVRRLTAARLARLQEQSGEDQLRVLEVESDGRPVVVAFSSPGCAACRTAQYPALQALTDQSDYHPRIISVDISERPEVAQAFGILTVPSTVVLAASGRVLTANHGFAPLPRLIEQVSLAASP